MHLLSNLLLHCLCFNLALAFASGKEEQIPDLAELELRATRSEPLLTNHSFSSAFSFGQMASSSSSSPSSSNSTSNSRISEQLGSPPQNLRSLSSPQTRQVHLRVLLTDDSPLLNKMLSRLIQTAPSKYFKTSLSFTIDIALNGLEAIKKMNQRLPSALQENTPIYDLIFMDREMPEMDGPEAIQAIRKLEAENSTLTRSVIVGHSANAGRELFGEVELDHYFDKPIRPAQLCEVLRHHWNLAIHSNCIDMPQTPMNSPSMPLSPIGESQVHPTENALNGAGINHLLEAREPPPFDLNLGN